MDAKKKRLIKYQWPVAVLAMVLAYPASLPLAVSLTKREVIPRKALLAYIPLLRAWEQRVPHTAKVTLNCHRSHQLGRQTLQVPP